MTEIKNNKIKVIQCRISLELYNKIEKILKNDYNINGKSHFFRIALLEKIKKYKFVEFDRIKN